jgi:RNA polymerase sigma-70 factor (ECF subfamily)
MAVIAPDETIHRKNENICQHCRRVVKSPKHILSTEELALVKKAQAGDGRAFTQLVKQYENLVYSFAFKVCRDKEKTENTWQDTFVNIYRKLRHFDGKSKFTT